MKKNIMKKIISQRFADARKMANLSQEDVAKKMGFNDRQIISYIESAKRQLSADELLSACALFNKDIDFFTDPYISNKQITWRAPSNNKYLINCENYVNKIIAANIHFSEILNEPFYPIDVNIHKNKLSTYEKAFEAAESIVEKWKLGDYPAITLSKKAQEELNLDILYIDCPDDISGGACKTDKINFIFVNRNDIFYRRNFTIGHEIFHILTWDTWHPDHIDPIDDNSNTKSRRESLADNFTSALLMPKKTIAKLWDTKSSKSIKEINYWILDTAVEFRVSGEALFWRMVNLKLMDKSIFKELNLSNRPRNKKKEQEIIKERVNHFNDRFAHKIYNVLENGLVSLKKVTEVISMPPEKLVEILSSYNYKLSFEI